MTNEILFVQPIHQTAIDELLQIMENFHQQIYKAFYLPAWYFVAPDCAALVVVTKQSNALTIWKGKQQEFLNGIDGT